MQAIPENAVLNTFKGPKNSAVYLHEAPLQIDQKTQSVSFVYLTYFVVRDYQLANTQAWWTEVQRLENPDGQTSVGVYRSIDGCLPKMEST